MADFQAAMDWGKSIELLSHQTGLQAEALDQLALTAKLSDVSAESLSKTLDKLSKSMVAARNPASELNAIFAALKVDPEGNPAEVFQKVVVAINSIPDPALRAATAIAVLGKGGAETAAKMADMAEDSKRAQEAIAAFGPVTQAQADASKSLSDSFALAGQAAQRVLGPVIEQLAPAFEDIVKAMEAVLGESTGLASTLGGALANALRIVAALVVDLVAGIQVAVIAVVDFIKTLSALASLDWRGALVAANDALERMGVVATGTAAAHKALLEPALKDAGTAARGTTVDALALADAVAKAGAAAAKASDDAHTWAQKFRDMLTAQGAGIAPATQKSLDELNAAVKSGGLQWGDYQAAMKLVLANDPAATKAQNDIASAAKRSAEELDKLAAKWTDVIAAQDSGVSPTTVKDLEELDSLLDAGRISWENYGKGIDAALAKDPSFAAQQKAIDAADASVVAMTDSLAAQNNQYANQLAMMGKTEVEQQQAIADQKIQNALVAELANLQKTLANDPAHLAEASKNARDNAAAITQVTNSWIAAADAAKQYNTIVNAQDAQNKQLAEDVQLLGLEGTARASKLAQLKEEQALTLATTDADRQRAQAVFGTTQAYLAQIDAFNKSYSAWQNVFQTAEQWGTKFFTSMSQGMSGIKDWAKQAGDALKQYLAQVIYELTVKPFVVQIATSIVGGLGGNTSALAAAAGNSNSGSALGQLGALFGGGGGGGTGLLGSIGTVGSTIGSLFGGGAAAASTAGAVAGMGGGTASLFGGVAEGASAFATEMAGTTAATSALAGGAAAATASLATMIPVVGAFIAVGYLAYTLLSQPKGGPKSGGSASSGDDSATFNRFFTPNDQDASIQKLTDGISSAFDASLAQLGGTGQASFALGFDTDPQGTAGSRVSSAATVGGKQVYATHDVDVGRSDTAVQQAMQTETERLLLSALQASDLPPAMAAILNTVAAATASATDVTNVIALAGAFKQIQDVATAMVNPMDAAAQAINDSNATAMDAYEKQREAFDELAKATPPTAVGLAALSQASQDLYKSTVTMIAGMVQLKQTINGMFSDTRESILRSTMDTPELYEHIRQQTQGLYTQLQTATDPAKINSITSQINANINTEWGMLTPEQQKQQQSDFLTGLDNVNNLAQQRLDASIQTVTDQSNTDQATLTDTLNKILDSITGAAGDFKEGADSVTKAASAGINVNVRVTDDRATAEVTG